MSSCRVPKRSTALPESFDEGEAPSDVRQVEPPVSEDDARQRATLVGLVSAMSGPAALLDTEGRVLEASHAALEAAGIDLEALRGTPYSEVCGWGGSAALGEARLAVERAARGETVHFESDGANGELARCSLAPLTDRAGAVSFLLWQGRELGGARRAEAKRARALGDLEELRARQHALEARERTALADASHELRTPLTLILGPVESVLAGSNLTDAQRRDLEVVRSNAATLLAQVTDLLDAGRLDAGRMELRYSEVDLSAIVARLARHFESLAREREIEYVVELPPRLVAHVDAALLPRVVTNLLSNAFKAAPAGGRVRIALRSDRDRARITVEDSGLGVAPEERARIFERFRQGDAAPARHRGSGLGLAIAKEVVELHGGSLTLRDASGGGALFLAELPIVAPDDARVRRGGQELDEREALLEGTLALAEPARASLDAPRATVLVVEDDAETSRFIVESLGGDVRALTASDGEEGLAKALAERPDLIVTDLLMPKMTGDRMAEAIRARRELDGVPILVLSGKTEAALRIDLLRRGAQDYLVKPFSREELRVRAHNLVALKRAREVLSAEVAGQKEDLEILARAVAAKNRELSTACDAMRVARDGSEAANRAKSSFLQLCSHELRTPLTTIHLQLEMLELEGAMPEAQKARLRRLEAAAQRLHWLVESLLQHARMESARMELAPRELELRAVLEDVVGDLAGRAERKGLALGLTAEDVRLRSDPALVRLVVLNLVDNAIKFTESGHVRVRAARCAGGARIDVEDTGRGIAPEERMRIFDPFEQLEDVRRKHTPGVGLGLTLVQQMIEALGGHVDLSSEIGRGSTFTVTLPDLGEATDA